MHDLKHIYGVSIAQIVYRVDNRKSTFQGFPILIFDARLDQALLTKDCSIF